MPDGGDLTITLDRLVVERGETPPVAGVEAGDWARLIVTDTGIGMTAEVQEHMFEPFFTTKDEEGTGLGLSQVYGIVTQHGGHIDVESAPGRGSTFTILLPLVDDDVDEEEVEPRRSPPSEPRGETILVVEDAAPLLGAITKGLESIGYDVLTAKNGLEALDLLSSDGLSLVLTDVVMPRLGGEALLRAIRAQSPDLQVIAMTGHTMKISESSLREAGFDDVLAKPFSIEDLVHFVQQTLET